MRFLLRTSVPLGSPDLNTFQIYHRGLRAVHRVILAASSDYFHRMFTLNMKESHQSCVSLPFVLVSELEVLVGSSYSGTLPLSWTSIFEITSTALQLQHQPALSLCFNFLQQEITPHTCLDVVSFAEAFEMPHLLEAAEDYILQHFQEVARTSKFTDLPARQLLKYLNSKSLCVSSELIVFNAVVSWITAKPNVRLKLARELLRTVHFPLMTFKEFKEVQSRTLWCDHSLAGLFGEVLEDFCSSESALQHRCRSYSPKECLVLIGGDQISEDLSSRSVSRELWFGNSLRNLTGIKKTVEWRKLGEMPESERFSHEVAVMNKQLYVFGGKKYYGIGDALNSVFRFDPHQNRWESLSKMQEKRSLFSAVVLDGKIYAIGGLREPDHMDSVECYCPTTNVWSFTRRLDLPLSGHVAKVFKEQIFVSGGQNNDCSCLSSMFVYRPETGSTFLANMSKPRAHHCMEVLGEGIYVAGGLTTKDDGSLINQLACEVYSPAANSWTAFASLSVPHVGAGSVILEGRLYLLGGYSQEDHSDTKMVHRFDTAMQKWENIGRTPGPNNDLRACLLTLPQHLRA
ncbi:transcript variant X1 [Nothobranchius furzeri]|uniref:Transcript variant X1 n=1 Tax=Nothobranchius furzeri TaxID=105023 RepID=A0A9D2Y5Z2_NOTFU|nr:transcript variant X1 [Nothobranchius furzeri]